MGVTYHVWAAGRRWLPPKALWMLNFWMPRIPCSVANPPSGTCTTKTEGWIKTNIKININNVKSPTNISINTKKKKWGEKLSEKQWYYKGKIKNKHTFSEYVIHADALVKST